MYLKQVVKHGLEIKKIHKVLEFDQKPWLKPLIDLNCKLRREATNECQKNLAKIMMNATFGKTLENVRNHRDIKILNKWDG